MKLKSLSEVIENMLEDMNLPDEGENFQLIKDIIGVDEVDSKWNTTKKNQTIKAGSKLEIKQVSNTAIYTKSTDGHYYGFYSQEWKSLPVKMI